MSVTLTLHGPAGVIEVKRLNGQGGYDPGKLVEKASGAVSTDQLKAFRALFSVLDFWNQPVSSEGGADGSQWILEAAMPGRYDVVTRWTPKYPTLGTKYRAFVAVCEWLYRASPVQAPAQNRGDVEIGM